MSDADQRGDTASAEYRRAVEALQARGRFGIRLGLGRTRALLHALGDPQAGIRGALIAGTNGKGSVQQLVATALREAGYRVGQTPSPHLVTYRERIDVAGEPISPSDFAILVHEVLRAEIGVARRLGHATEFELLTAAAFRSFDRAAVDVAIVEVGMGGRLDATNAWDGGVAAITNIDWDHVDRLGPTLEAIAAEKAAIIKPGNRAVTGALPPGLDVIRARARRVGAVLREVAPLPVISMDRRGTTLRAPDGTDLLVALLGRHQGANAAVALAVLEELDAAGIARVDQEAIAAGFAATRWPGRLELLAVDRLGRASPAPSAEPDPDRPDVLLDGAHNVSGITALGTAYDELRPQLSPGRATMVVGLMRDKDVPGMARALLGSGLRDARMIATSIGGERALPARELAHAIDAAAREDGRQVETSALEPVTAALDAALAWSRMDGGPLVVAGSLYLVGEVRALLFPGTAGAD